jgi:hypothetical protein
MLISGASKTFAVLGHYLEMCIESTYYNNVKIISDEQTQLAGLPHAISCHYQATDARRCPVLLDLSVVSAVQGNQGIGVHFCHQLKAVL